MPWSMRPFTSSPAATGILHVMGRSTPNGFILYGDLPTDAVHEAAQEALERLRAGEHYLAVHPTCGTNAVAAGTLAGLGAFLVLSPAAAA
jgi:hypothetical protein